MYDIKNEEITKFIKENNATTRETAEYFGISRQTVSNRVEKTKNKEIKQLLNSHHYKHKFKKIKIKKVNKMNENKYKKIAYEILNEYDKNWEDDPLDSDEIDELVKNVKKELNYVNGNLSKDDYVNKKMYENIKSYAEQVALENYGSKDMYNKVITIYDIYNEMENFSELKSLDDSTKETVCNYIYSMYLAANINLDCYSLVLTVVRLLESDYDIMSIISMSKHEFLNNVL